MGDKLAALLAPYTRPGPDENTKRIATSLELPDLNPLLITEGDKAAMRVANQEDGKMNVSVEGDVRVTGTSLDEITAAITAMDASIEASLESGFGIVVAAEAATEAAVYAQTGALIADSLLTRDELKQEIGNVDESTQQVYGLLKSNTNFADGIIGPLGFRSIGYYEDPRGSAFSPIPMTDHVDVSVDASHPIPVTITDQSVPVRSYSALSTVPNWGALPATKNVNVVNAPHVVVDSGQLEASIIGQTHVVVDNTPAVSVNGEVHVQVDNVPSVNVSGTVNTNATIVHTNVALHPSVRDNGADVVLVPINQQLASYPGNFYGSSMLVGVDRQYITPSWDSIRAVATQENSDRGKLFIAS